MRRDRKRKQKTRIRRRRRKKFYTEKDKKQTEIEKNYENFILNKSKIWNCSLSFEPLLKAYFFRPIFMQRLTENFQKGYDIGRAV